MASIKPRSGSKIILNQLTKDLFLKGIVEARKAQAECIQNFTFNKSRCRVLSQSDDVKGSASGILYWMSRDCRVQDNWAMLYAQRLAIKLKVPLFVCFICKGAEQLYPTKRQFKFLLGGLRRVQKQCEDLNIHFKMLNSSPEDLAEIIVNNDIGGVICDFSPLKCPTKMWETLLEHLPDSVPVVQVDAHNIIPAWEASDKQELMAKFIRPKISNKLPVYLTGFPEVCRHEYTGTLDTDQEFKRIEDAYTAYNPKWDVSEVQWGSGPGENAGLEMLHSFITKDLEFYGVTSNDPSKDNTSKLSPWLHFGQISAQRCALEVKSVESLHKDACAKFLEELIVRRELADNYCFYNKSYDNLNGATLWAQDTLKRHEGDKRTWVYTREQLEKAQTHDDIWNAAQLQATKEGKINGYMRMYWCKKILEWTESPGKAIEYALWLNDTYCLDGSDPNGYVGVMWSICGVHDQGWKEREIFGKIRYMVDYSLQRKYDMVAYCARYGLKISKSTKKNDTGGPSGKKGVKRKIK